MASPISQVNVAANATFQVLIDQVNKAINAISNFVVTIDTSANGVLDTGSAFPNRLYLGNSTVNTSINSSILSTNTANVLNLIIGNILANTTVFQIGSNVVGNTTVFKVGSVISNTSMLTVGGSNVVTIANRSAVAKANTLIGTQPRINFIEGNNVTINVADDGSQLNVTLASATIGNSIPGGSDTQVQYNDGGNLAADDNFIWNKNSSILGVSNTIISNQLIVNCVSIIPSVKTVSSNAIFTLDSFFLLNFRTVEYTLSVTDNNANNYQASKILIVHNNGNAFMTEYAQIFTNNIVATFSLTTNATHGILRATPVTSSNTSYNYNKALIGV